MGKSYQVGGKNLSYQYKHFISDYPNWKQRDHTADHVLFKENISEQLSMNETCLSCGELYTIITNKSGKGRAGSLLGMIKGTSSEVVLHYLLKLPKGKRLKVKEITIDLSPSMKLIASKAFPHATIVSDRFHVQKLINEPISDLRVDYRLQAIDMENAEIDLAKEMGRKYIAHTFSNRDTRRQLLARSRHIVMKHFSK